MQRNIWVKLLHGRPEGELRPSRVKYQFWSEMKKAVQIYDSPAGKRYACWTAREGITGGEFNAMDGSPERRASHRSTMKIEHWYELRIEEEVAAT
jgi:hypothetical protein